MASLLQSRSVAQNFLTSFPRTTTIITVWSVIIQDIFLLPVEKPGSQRGRSPHHRSSQYDDQPLKFSLLAREAAYERKEATEQGQSTVLDTNIAKKELEGDMSPRPDVSEERKNQILEAAIAVFARLGFDQSRMEDIAGQAGLSKGALYLYYKSKDAIVAALLKYFFAQEFKRLQTFVETDQEGSVVEQVLTLTRQLVQAMQWMAKMMPIAFEFYALAGRDQEVRQFLKQYYQDYRRALASLIERGIKQGEFRAVDSQTAATSLVALYEGLALLFFVDPEADQWAEQVETSVHFLLEGLGPTGCATR